MNSYLRIFWLIALTTFTAGCSGFQSACYTFVDDPGLEEDTPWEDCEIRAGDKVRITTLDGKRVVGRIDRVSSDWIVFQPEIASSSPRIFSPSWVLSIEKSTASPSEPAEMDQPEIGDVVSLYLQDGSRVEGEVLFINDRKIVFDHIGQSSQSLGYPADQILWMTVKKGKGSSWVGPVVGILVAGAVVGGIYLYKVGQELDNMWGN